jgi:hypothetical protein
MMKHFKVLLSVLLIALAGGCGDKAEEDLIGGILGPPGMVICFIDSEGQDLLTGIPTIKWVTEAVEYTGDFVSSDVCPMKTLFINDEEIQVVQDPMPLIYEEYTGEPYKALCFTYGYIWMEINDKSNETVYTVRSEIVCPYIFGNDEAHILTGELIRMGEGKIYGFHKCWFDGVEASPTYFGEETGAAAGMQKPDIFIVRVDR